MPDWKTVLKKIKTSPKTPGVYIFYGKNKKSLPAGRQALYIGKASNLKNRLQSYVKGADSKSERLQKNTTDLKIIRLRSEIEALIEEARIIKKLNPPYNILWRDGKSYFYASFTGEKLPRIFVAHKNSLFTNHYSLITNSIGPFTEGRSLKLVLRMLRRNFPYCTCPKPHLRLCLNAQIGNCFGFCCRVRRSEDAKSGKRDKQPTLTQTRAYRKNILTIKNFLLGKPLKKITKNLKPEEREALEKILAHREFLDYQAQTDADYTQTNPEAEQARYGAGADKFRRILTSSQRQSALSQRKSALIIEGYDISHLSGRETVAGMTAWELAGGTLRSRKEFWRKFIIRSAKPADDPAAIVETVSRRLNHPEWPYPDIMLIDGGLAQFNAAREVVEKAGLLKKICVISFAKPGQLVYGLEKNPRKLGDSPAELKKIIPRVVQETHNFAVRFHRARRRKKFLSA